MACAIRDSSTPTRCCSSWTMIGTRSPPLRRFGQAPPTRPDQLDGDAAVVPRCSVREVTGVPILSASTEKLEDLDVFHPDRMASRILAQWRC